MVKTNHQSGLCRIFTSVFSSLFPSFYVKTTVSHYPSSSVASPHITRNKAKFIFEACGGFNFFS